MPLDNIGSYKILELLGSGAMGEVYRATDSKLFDRVVAVKVLGEKYARNENARSRFQNEVQYAAHLDHPNIVKIYDQGESDGRPYFVMEFLDGIDLARFMKSEPNRSVERCVEIARQLAEALEFAHRHNVVHRDVKPANVMVVKRGDTEQIKLVDFGIIHVEASKMTRDGTQPGTSAYSSPEQLRNDPVDHRSDLFALGIVLYELFTNVYPFDAPSEALITHYILQREPESPRKKSAGIPAAVDALIMKLLEKDSTQRPQTAGEVADSLRQQHRRLQSRWASTDPAEYENLDEITREAVDRLINWARQKEADGALTEAVQALEKALKLAPDSDRIRGRIPKLKHRIESEKVLHEHMDKATAALASGRFPEAREHWKQAWILSPESEDVAALELRIEQTEKAVPDDSEKRKFIESVVARAEEHLDGGHLDQARSEIIKILQRYPNEPLANFMLERILAILMADVDYVSYRKLVRDARELSDGGKFAEARARCGEAQALWPGDEEAAGVDREIAERIEDELATLPPRVEKHLLSADEPDTEPQDAFQSLASVRTDIAKALALGSTAAWIAQSTAEADRIEAAINDRVARAETALREQAEQRRKRIDMFLERGRNQLSAADAAAVGVTVDAAPVVAAYGLARDSYESVLADDAGNAEALEARRTIEGRLHALAERVEQSQQREKAIDGALEEARSAVASAEIAGGPRAPDIGSVAMLLDEADAAIDRVMAVDPKHPDAVSLRGTVAGLRTSVVEEQSRREKREADARREQEEAVRRADEAEARRLEEERAKAKAAEEAERRRIEAERKREEDAKRATEAEERKAAEAQRRETERKAKESTHAPAPVMPAATRSTELDPRKLAEFEKGLAKHQRLIKQGKTREAAEIQKILQSEVAADPKLSDAYTAAFPPETKAGSKRGLVMGGVAAAVVIVVAVGFFATRKGAPEPAPVSHPEVRELPPEPTFAPAAAPPPPVAAPEPAASTTQAPVPAAPVEIQPAKSPLTAQKPTPKETTSAAKPEAPPQTAPPPAAAVAKTAEPPPFTEHSDPPPAAAAIAAGQGRIEACLQSESGAALGSGYRVSFSVSGSNEVRSASTGASGCATLAVPLPKGAARVRIEAVDGPDGNRRAMADRVSLLQVVEGSQLDLKVRVKE